MADSTERCVRLLSELVAYRTENPTGDELALCHRLADELQARGAEGTEVVEVHRPPGRAGYVFARYGVPRTLINVHVDTVPANTGWTRDPYTAEDDGRRIHGLGTADTKGAIAAVLTALDEVRPDGVGILFSGDEEKAGVVMDSFVASARTREIERAIVCEPTAHRGGIRHRGILGYEALFRGRGGHSSEADHMPKPVVTMARLAVALDDIGRSYLDRGPEDMKGICMNVASLDGGVAFNVVPGEASLAWSVRPPPGFDPAAFDRKVDDAVQEIAPSIQVSRIVDKTGFETRDVESFRALIGDHVDELGALQFWTEAAVLSNAGIDAVVVGPGDIGQAHGADEFVTRDDLDWAVDLFRDVFERTRKG